jgi:hypothetical protein
MIDRQPSWMEASSSMSMSMSMSDRPRSMSADTGVPMAEDWEDELAVEGMLGGPSSPTGISSFASLAAPPQSPMSAGPSYTMPMLSPPVSHSAQHSQSFGMQMSEDYNHAPQANAFTSSDSFYPSTQNYQNQSSFNSFHQPSQNSFFGQSAFPSSSSSSSPFFAQSQSQSQSQQSGYTHATQFGSAWASTTA